MLEARYLRRENGQIVETPEELFRRVARNIAAVDGEVYGKDPGQVRELEDRFYRFITQREFMPNSPTLMNAGLPCGSFRPASCCRWRTPWKASSRR